LEKQIFGRREPYVSNESSRAERRGIVRFAHKTVWQVGGSRAKSQHHNERRKGRVPERGDDSFRNHLLTWKSKGTRKGDWSYSAHLKKKGLRLRERVHYAIGEQQRRRALLQPYGRRRGAATEKGGGLPLVMLRTGAMRQPEEITYCEKRAW